MRKSGIEILRAVAMLMVVTLHVLGAGGILNALEPFTPKYYFAWFLEIISMCAVNCFGLISGWLMAQKAADYRRIIRFALQVFFYTFCIWVLTRIFGWHTASWQLILKSSLPHNTPLWYAKSYLLLLFLTPVLNAFVVSLEGKRVKCYFAVSLILFSLLPTVSAKDFFFFNSGYNVWWLAVLYVWGGMLRKWKLDEKIKAWQLISALVCVETASYLSKVLVEYLLFRKTGEYTVYGNWIAYTSPLIVFKAMVLLLLCLKIRAQWLDHKGFRLLFESMFGVYLIHMNYVVNGRWITNKYIAYASVPGKQMAGCLVIRIAQIYGISLILSVFLMIAYKRILKIWEKFTANYKDVRKLKEWRRKA